MSKIKHFFEQSWLLIVASFLFGLLIAVTNAAWSGRIEQNKIKKLNDKMAELLPKAKGFQLEAELTVAGAKGKQMKSNLYKAVLASGECAGWAFNTRGSGFADKIELVVAVDRDFEKLAGYGVLFSNETPGFGDQIKDAYYRDQFVGAPAEELMVLKRGDEKIIDSEIIAISGATVSSDAVVKIINDAMGQIEAQMQEKGLIGNAK